MKEEANRLEEARARLMRVGIEADRIRKKKIAAPSALAHDILPCVRCVRRH